ncbi:MAG: polysaccharide pyruvyl transferase family protein [Candidatus Moraniibacteriota bacterium]
MNISNIREKREREYVEVSADIRYDGETEVRTLWFCVFSPDQEVAVGPEPFIAATLIDCMWKGEDIFIDGSISGKLLRSIEDIIGCHVLGNSELNRIRIHAGAGDERNDGNGFVGSFFSGGVDSFYTLLKNKDEITHLILVRGLDIGLNKEDDPIWEETVQKAGQVAREYGKRLVPVVTNIRFGFSDTAASAFWAESVSGSFLCSVGLLLSGLFGKIFIPSSLAYNEIEPHGSHPFLDQLWSTDHLRFVQDGVESTRVEKIERYVSGNVANVLRVCWENRDKKYNCCTCEKCVRTMISLDLFGRLGQADAFLEKGYRKSLERINLGNTGYQLSFWEEILKKGRELGKGDIVRSVEGMLAASRRKVLLNKGRGYLLAKKRTFRYLMNSVLRFARIRKYILLIGGDGGWGNLGDESILAVAKKFYRGYGIRYKVVIFTENPPMIPDGFCYRKNVREFFRSEAIVSKDVALIHYYGGGYLNKYWYDQKIWLLREAVSFGVPYERIVFSGQGLGPFLPDQEKEMGSICRHSPLFGTRDTIWQERIPNLTFSFDDTIALFDEKKMDRPKENSIKGSGKRRIGINFRADDYLETSDGEYGDLLLKLHRFVSEDPDQYEIFFFSMMDGKWVSESRSFDGICDSLGTHIGERHPKADSYSEFRNMIESADVVITTSYHGTLFSLYSGVPAIALHKSDYYERKSRGLSDVLRNKLLQIAEIGEFSSENIREALVQGESVTEKKRLRSRLGELKAVSENFFGLFADKIRKPSKRNVCQ